MAHNGTTWKALREAADLSIREAAKRAGIHHARLADIERGFDPAEEARLKLVLLEAIQAKGERDELAAS
jgi:transcriptional regulator with XRE-family HTH domain